MRGYGEGGKEQEGGGEKEIQREGNRKNRDKVWGKKEILKEKYNTKERQGVQNPKESN